MTTATRLWARLGDVLATMQGRVAAVILVVVVRVGVPLYTYARDSVVGIRADDAYLGPALALVRERRYMSAPGSGVPEFTRTPGYPAFLAVWLGVSDERYWLVYLVQGFIGAASVLLVYWLARRCGLSRQWAAVAALVLLVDAFSISSGGRIGTESLAAFTTTLLVAAGVGAVTRVGATSAWLLFGFTVSLSTMVRPTTFYLPVVAALMILVWSYRTPQRARAGARCVGALLVGFLPVAAYCVRNQAEFGSTSVASAEAITMYWYRAGWNLSQTEGIPWDPDARTLLTQRLIPELTAEQAHQFRNGSVVPPQWNGSIGEYYDLAQKRGIEILLDDPGLSAKQFVRGLYSQFVVTGWQGAWREVLGSRLPRRLDLATRPYILMVNVLGLAGLLLASRGRDRVAWIAALIVVYVLLVSAGNQAVAGARMRAPIMPLIALGVPLSLRVIARYISGRRRQPSEEVPG